MTPYGWIPYKPDVEAWKRYFAHPEKQLPSTKSGFHPVRTITPDSHKKEPQIKIELVTPVAAAVKRAKSELKKEKEEEESTHQWSPYQGSPYQGSPYQRKVTKKIKGRKQNPWNKK